MKKLKIIFAFTLFTLNFAFAGSYSVDEVRVYKTRHRMEMLYQGKVVRVFTVMLSRGGMGPKRQEGDKRVPEGKYILDAKNPYSKYYRSIHISYPNEEDVERAKDLGVNPGGDIFIHGMPSLFDLRQILPEETLSLFGDWTAGCIAVKNPEMREIWNTIEVPIPITIFH